jgi:hypothetical protein
MRRGCLSMIWMAIFSVSAFFLFFLSTSRAQSSSKPNGCESSYSLQTLDPNVLKLLGTPALPTNPNLQTSLEYLQQRDWDFPSKVTLWSQRPSPEEIAHRREELAGTNTAENAKPKNAALPAWTLWNYGIEPFSPRDWSDLQKWFAKEAPKKMPGACVDPPNADHILMVGVIVLGSSATDSTGARIQYGQTVGQIDTTVGPNSGISPAVGTHRASQELGGNNDSIHPGAHTCVYLFTPKPRREKRNSGSLLLPFVREPTSRLCRRSPEIHRRPSLCTLC